MEERNSSNKSIVNISPCNDISEDCLRNKSIQELINISKVCISNPDIQQKILDILKDTDADFDTWRETELTILSNHVHIDIVIYGKMLDKISSKEQYYQLIDKFSSSQFNCTQKSNFQ